ncbi:MAG: hypothetical protein LBV26_04450 [Bacteroidales bacterium]|jgi:hypothetical protein|nr:hypothetical protein [Bacteroidales bacterium]
MNNCIINSGSPVKVSVLTIAVLAMFLQPVTVSAQFAGGNGTSASPYQISTAAQLDSLARKVNSKDAAYVNKHYILTADIDLSGYGASNANFNNGKGWIPIGASYATPFGGVLNGNGKKITGLYINRDGELSGLFGFLTGTVKNLGLENVNVTGQFDVGGLTGMMYNGMIANCYVTGHVKGIDQAGAMAGSVCFSSIKNCYTAGTVSARVYVGGIVGGSINGQIENCAALNAIVEATNGTSVRRIVGYYGGSLTVLTNIAFAGMIIKAQGALQSPVSDPFNLSDGKGCTASEIAAIKFSELFVFATPGDDPWTYEDGKLPGFGAAIDMPEYFYESRPITEPAE